VRRNISLHFSTAQTMSRRIQNDIKFRAIIVFIILSHRLGFERAPSGSRITVGIQLSQVVGPRGEVSFVGAQVCRLRPYKAYFVASQGIEWHQ
jgi:hypothetical protein